MTMPHRILLLLPEETESSEPNVLQDEIQRSLVALLAKPLVVTNSHVWYEEEFPRAGSQESWIWNTVHRRDYSTNRPVFSGFVLCETQLDQANASIVSLALTANRPVWLHHEDGNLTRVKRVVDVDAVRHVE